MIIYWILNGGWGGFAIKDIIRTSEILMFIR